MNLCPYSDEAKKSPLPENYLFLVSETDNSVTLKIHFKTAETDKAYRVEFKSNYWGFNSWIPKSVCKINKEAKTIEIQKWWATKNLIKWKGDKE